MTVASEITKLQSNLADCYTAVSDKGGTMPEHENFDNLATAISSINATPTPTPVPFVQPILSANGTIGGDSFAVAMSSEYSGRPAWHAFDGVTTLNAQQTNTAHTGNSMPSWFEFYNPEPICVTKMAVWNGNITPHDYQFQCSEDGVTWTTLVTGLNTYTGTTYIGYKWEFDVPNTNYYKYYRFYVTSGDYQGYCSILEFGITATVIEGGGAVIDSLSITPSTSAQTFTASGGVNGYSPVNVSAVTASIDANIQAGNIKNGVTILGVTGTYGTPTGKYQLLDRITDDLNNEIGTVSGFFTDGNDVEYAVVCLDAQYRNDSTQWCSNSSSVTNLPAYTNNVSSWWYNNAHETATENTQLILDYCSAEGYTSTACSHCRSLSFTIDGTTYYGQLPNMRELFDIWVNRADIETLDTSASTSTSTNFSTSRDIWSSTQQGVNNSYALKYTGGVNPSTKNSSYLTCPVLELPNAL